MSFTTTILRQNARFYATNSKFGTVKPKLIQPIKKTPKLKAPPKVSPNKTAPKSDARKTSMGKKLFYGFISTTGLIYTYDKFFGYDLSGRTSRSLYVLLRLSYDYKMNFYDGADIDALHERNAQRLYDLIIENKGLYIKMGQMIAVQGMMFPKHYQDKFKLLFDKAPTESWETCDRTLQHDLGPDYREKIFLELDETPIASASVAQVHRGTLKNGDKVAVKIQKKSVSSQIDSDLFTFRAAMSVYAYVFDLPLQLTMDYICDKMREELDFFNEYNNAMMITKLIENDTQFSRSHEYYIPKYYQDISGKKILISEWIDAELIGQYHELANKGFNLRKIMSQITRIYARQVFTWGVVHCDLHPGNLMVRDIEVENTNILTKLIWPKKQVQQLVILDHGLYEHFTPKFKREYSEFWKYSMEKNYTKTVDILTAWGMEVDEMVMAFAGVADMNSEIVKSHISKVQNASYFERQEMMRDRLRQFLKSTDKFPLSLVFVMRSMRIVAGLNMNFGSPVNRLSILVQEAERSVDQLLLESGNVDTWSEWLMRTWVSQSAIILTDIFFDLHKVWEFIFGTIFHQKVSQVEEIYDKKVTEGGELFGFENVPSSSELIV